MYDRSLSRLPEDRFFRKVVMGPGGCHIWTAGTNGKAGYGQFYLSRENDKELAHRVAWLFHYGEWPSLELDHKCRVTLCVNPLHLEDVTHRVNVLRRPSFITHRRNNPSMCAAGLHDWIPENLRKDRQECRLCYNARKRNQRKQERNK